MHGTYKETKIHIRIFYSAQYRHAKSLYTGTQTTGDRAGGGVYIDRKSFHKSFQGQIASLTHELGNDWLLPNSNCMVSAFIFPSQWALWYTHITFLFVLSKWCHLHILLPHLFSVELRSCTENLNLAISQLNHFELLKMTLRRIRSIWKYITLNWINT